MRFRNNVVKAKFRDHLTLNWSERTNDTEEAIRASDLQGLLGRWDLTLDMDGSPAPGWLEVSLSGFSTLVGNFVSYTGSARPASHIKLDGNTFSFAIPPQWEGGAGDFVVEGEFTEGALKGTLRSNKC